MRFDDVWMQQWQLDKLVQLAIDSCQEGNVAVEVGVHQGHSAIPIASAIYPVALHAVDHWQGSTDFRSEMLARDNFSIFASNITECRETTNIHIHRQDWREFARYWTSMIGFLHLDAEHTKDEVSDQIHTFRPFMADGGILAGDDYDWPGVREGIAIHFERNEIKVMNNKLWWVEF